MPWIKVFPYVDYSVREVCTRPYPNHPHGCPNYGSKEGCPPHAPLFPTVYDSIQPVYAIYSCFDMESHVRKMHAKHPTWSDKQLRCSRYWQNSVRSKVNREGADFLRQHPGYHLISKPEALGIDLHRTMLASGIVLQWPPKTIAYHIILAARLLH